MTDSYIINHARKMVRIAPWACVLAIALAAIFAIWVRTPLNYLVWSAGFGAIWFVLLSLVWRVRHDAISIFALILFILGHMALQKRLLVDDTFFGALQGVLVSIAMVFALIVLLRRWVFMFARLEAVNSDSIGG